MKTMLTLTIALCLASNAVAEEQGAKAIFVDSTSGAVFHRATANKQPAAPAKARSTTRRAPQTRAAAASAEVSGLMYYVESDLTVG